MDALGERIAQLEERADESGSTRMAIDLLAARARHLDIL